MAFRKIIQLIIVCIIIFSTLQSFPLMSAKTIRSLPEQRPRGTIIIVDINGSGNYTSIQDAIDSANSGDTIFVWAGTYNESIVISKKVSLIGNGTKNTTIIADWNEDGVCITANWVNISGFNITSSDDPYTTGIKIEKDFLHITKFIMKLFDDGKLQLKNSIPEDFKMITIHDPCLIARNLNDTESIRGILNKIPDLEIVEPIYNKEYVHCCGWSGTAHWADKDLAISEAQIRINELKETGAITFISACPLCELGLAYGIEESEKEKYKILDISELLLKLL